MAVIQYVSPKGETLWKAYVSVRSQINPTIRIQKWKFSCKTQKQAEREEVKLLRECQLEIVKKETQGSSWGAVVEAWEEHMRKNCSDDLNEVTRDDYIAALRKHTLSWWNRTAASITPNDVREVLSQMKAHSSSVSYQNKVRVIINRIFVFGIGEGLIRESNRSPAYGIKLGRIEEKKPEILNVSQIRKLLSEAKRLNHSWYPVWATALLTGMRNGELYALEWTDVDFENREIIVSKSYNCRRRIVKCTKGSYWRSVPISQELMMLLKELKAEAQDRPHVLPRDWKWTKGLQAKEVRKFCIGIGLPSIKFHTLRACFATQLIRVGVAPAQIMKICGWKDLETMQRYIRLSGIETDGVTEKLKVLPDLSVINQAANLFAEQKSSLPVESGLTLDSQNTF